MIINPTKKALPIFNKLVKVADKDQAKRFATANPFFSWHANYYSVNRKKIVILVNDLTYATVVLYDINAKNKTNLARFITDGIRAAFKIAGISDKDIDAYFAMAGKIELNVGFNRQVTGVIVDMIKMADAGRFIDYRELIQVDLMNLLMQTPYKQKDYIVAKESVKRAFDKGLSIVENVTDLPEITYQVNKTWADYHQWDKYEENPALLEGDAAGYDRVVSEVQANNKLLLEEFKNYLTNAQGLSKKVVTKHVNNAKFFVNEFMAFYTIKTPLKSADDVLEYFSDWFPRKAAYSAAEIKTNAGSIKKFLTFMEVAGEISAENVKNAKEDIKDGVEMGIEYLQTINNMSAGW